MQLGMNEGIATDEALFMALVMVFHPDHIANVCILRHRFTEQLK